MENLIKLAIYDDKTKVCIHSWSNDFYLGQRVLDKIKSLLASQDLKFEEIVDNGINELYLILE